MKQKVRDRHRRRETNRDLGRTEPSELGMSPRYFLILYIKEIAAQSGEVIQPGSGNVRPHGSVLP